MDPPPVLERRRSARIAGSTHPYKSVHEARAAFESSRPPGNVEERRKLFEPTRQPEVRRVKWTKTRQVYTRTTVVGGGPPPPPRRLSECP